MNRFGFLIGRSDGRLVVLAPGDDLIGIVAKDDGAGVIGDFRQRTQHRRGRVGMNVIRHDAANSPAETPDASVENIFTIP